MLASLLFTILLWTTAILQDSVFFINENKIVFATKAKDELPIKSTISLVKKKKLYNENGLLLVKDSSLHYQVYNPKGLKIIDTIFEHYLMIDSRTIAFQNKGIWQLYSYDGKKKNNEIYSQIKQENKSWKLKRPNSIEIRNKDIKIESHLNVDSVYFLNAKLLVFRLGSLCGLMNYTTGERIFQPQFNQIKLLNDSLLIVQKNHKKGVISLSKQWIIPLAYDYIQKDTLNYIRIGLNKKIEHQNVLKYGICNYTGRVIIPANYEEVGFYAHPYFGVKNNKHWGFLDLKGEIAIPFSYATVGNFNSKGFAPVTLGFMAGVIDMHGSWVIFRSYQFFQIVNDSIWIWKKGDKMGFFDAHKGKIIQKSYQQIRTEPLGSFAIQQNNQWGLLNAKLESVLNAMYQSVHVYEKEKIIISDQNQYYSIYYLNGNLKVYMNYPFSKFLPYQEGMAMVVQKEKYGFIDKDGLLLVSTQYDEAHPFKNEMAAIRIGNKWGFINKHEKILVPPHYDKAWDFEKNVAVVKLNGKFGFVNKWGEEIIKPNLDNITPTPNGQYIIKLNNRYGLVNSDGIETVNPIYKSCEELSSAAIKVKLYAKYNFVSAATNQILSSQQYDEIEKTAVSDKYILTNYSHWEIFHSEIK
jgi:hypothetical protein